MVIQITSVRMEGGEGHPYITAVNWSNPREGQTGTYTMAELVDLIENQDGSAYITDGSRTSWMGIIETPTTKYVRAVADGAWTDDLLYIPRS